MILLKIMDRNSAFKSPFWESSSFLHLFLIVAFRQKNAESFCTSFCLP